MDKFAKIPKCLMLLLATTFSLTFVSCGGDDDDEPVPTPDSLFDSLTGTSWKTQSTTFYDYSNNIVSTYDNTTYPTIITFTNIPKYSTPTPYQLWVDMDPRDPGASFYGYKPGQTQVWYWEVQEENFINGFPGAGNCLGEILKLSATELHTKYTGNWEKNWYRIDKYTRVSEPSHNFKDNEGGNSNSGGSSSHNYPCKSCDESGKCWNCFGSGIDPITNKKCNTCHGSGKCQVCQGKGYIIV